MIFNCKYFSIISGLRDNQQNLFLKWLGVYTLNAYIYVCLFEKLITIIIEKDMIISLLQIMAYLINTCIKQKPKTCNFTFKKSTISSVSE